MKDYTEGSEELKIGRAKRMMLWFGIVSLGMSFAGLTSAYVVSKSRPDWIENLVLPSAFVYSLILIVLSSITFHFAKKKIQVGDHSVGMGLLIATLVLGLGFVYFQFAGFDEIIGIFGYNPTGPTANITYTFIFLIAVVHIAHIAAALICLLVVIYNHYKQRYVNGKTLGIELAATFWHFVDFLWIYLFLFFYFVR